MANEKDDQYELPEEGEYHFSDDQVNYEAEVEGTRPKPKQTLLEKMRELFQTRRPLVLGGAIVLLIIIFVLVRMLSPAGPAATEITPVPVNPLATAPGKSLPQTTTTTTKPGEPVPAMQAMPQPQATNGMTPEAQMQPLGLPVNAMLPAANNNPPMQILPLPGQPNPNMPANATMQMPGQQMMPQAMPQNSNQMMMGNGMLPQQQQAAPMTTAQQYVQKVSDLEQQNSLLKNKLDELGSRMMAMETNLNQLTQVLQQGNVPKLTPPPPVSMNQVSQWPGQQGVVPPPPPIAPQPMPTYNLQAVIPGRAWLKAADGSTLTVAVGDVIKNMGRVVNIDPYNGVVRVDTGTQIITLNYGDGANDN